MMPHYRRVTDAFRKYGTDIFFADSDGWNDNLIPLWMECGVNGYSPMEAAAGGKGPVELRKEYGHDLLLYGGMDKRVLAQDKEAVEKEVLGKLPYMVEKGGYIPTIDHAIPHDASFENYVYYRQLIRDVAEGRT
jgi:uroporphyrinogen decarboxylase